MEPARNELSGFGRFRVVERLGSGSTGVVYRAVDPETDREVALKTLRTTSSEDVYRLKREFRALVGISHPNLVELYELFALDERCFFTMELVDGRPCTEWVRRGRPATGAPHDEARTSRVAAVLRQLHAGLAAVHDAGHVHRDVKPANVLVSPAGRLVLLDFGLVAALGGDDPLETGIGVVAGTRAYMAPEQAQGAAPTSALDWYAVGVMLFEMLTGALPFAGPPPEMQRRKERRIVTVEGLPNGLAPLVLALLEPDPRLRAGADEVAAWLVSRGDERAPGPVSTAGAAPFCGRRREIERLERLLDGIGPERGAVVRVSGPSGIGKTRLVEHFVDRLAGSALVFRGRCLPNETLPYKALDRVVDDMSRYLTLLPYAEVVALAPRHLSALLRLFPVLGRVRRLADRAGPAVRLEPLQMRRRGFAALRELLGRIADREKVVVWIDDVQWGDEESGRLIAELLLPPDAPGVLLILSYPSEHDAIELLERLPTSEHLTLGPLSEEESIELAHAVLAGDPSASAVDTGLLARECEGSPLLLGELARHSCESGGATSAQTGGGSPIANLTRARLLALPADAREVLELAAVAGGPIERSTLIAAAGGSEPTRALLVLLRQRLLLRDTTIEQRPAVEVVHHRVREAVVDGVPAERRIECHRRLAEALERSGIARHEALAHHLHHAGEDRRASEHAAAAGDEAARSLAFLQAAAHYAVALAWRGEDAAWCRMVRRRRGDALVSAGRCAEAATEYLEAAGTASALDRLELRRLACKQLLAAGRVDDAIGVLRPLLAELGLPYPDSTLGAAARTLLRLVAAALRRPAASLASDAGAAPHDLLRVDVCDAVAKGLVPVDALRGVYFLVLGLRLARRAGEPGRYARFLAGVGGSVLVMGPRPLQRRGREMIDAADRIAGTLGDSYVAGNASAARGQVALMRGDWREALRLSDFAAELDRHVVGYDFERNVARMASLRSLEELGAFDELARRAEALRDEADAAADRYGDVTARLNLASVRIARDDPAGAREIAEDVLRRWSPHGFHVQHLYAHRVWILAALYEGAVEEAWARLRAIRPLLSGSGLLLVPLPRFDAHLLSARTELARAARRPEVGSDSLRAALRSIRRLERQPRLDAKPHAALLAGTHAALAGDPDAAGRLFAAAARQFASLGLDVPAACATLRLAGGDGEAAADATSVLQAHGIRRPERWIETLSPGFSGRAGTPG